MTIGKKITGLRTGAGMSQEELADMLDVSRQSVSKWEMDQSAPRVDKILMISKLFHLNVDELVDESLPLPQILLTPRGERVSAGTSSDKASLSTSSPGVASPEGNGETPAFGRYFGTDGFRGEAGLDLTSEQAFRVGRFLGWYYASPLSGCRERGYRPRIVIGKDTRRSSYTLEYAIAAGLTASGADAYMLHVTTTPSVSYVTRHDGFDCGVMISASHNPYYDNGIKLVNSRGEKMDDRTLSFVEDYLDGQFGKLGLSSGELPLSGRDRIGAIRDHAAGRNMYIGYLISLAAHSYRDLRIGLDCANGSAWMIAPAVFEALGAKTYVIGAEPDGQNINRDVGSTHIGALQELVKREKLDVGFAFDGDADRCIAVDEKGNEVNGDHILYILANRLKGLNNLVENTVVPTVMSNAGLFRALEKAGIRTVQTQVGDRYVWEEMAKHGYSLGGEQSGHIILHKYATTGDGILTALMLLEEVLDRKQPLSTLAAPVKILPQVLKSVRVTDKDAVMNDPDVTALVEQIGRELGRNGRILLRRSGTEPVVRVMTEGDDVENCRRLVDSVLSLIRKKGLASE